MIKNFILLFTVVTLAFACGESQSTSNENNEETGLQYFGDKISQDGSITYDNLLTKLSSSDSVQAKVVGEVTDVCQTKGCWMTIASEGDGEVMMVKFKDYGFFVPKDISGRKVVMDGYAFRETTSVDELRHYAEDAGKSKEEIEAITEPEEELKFLASGVILLEEEGGSK